MPQGDGAANAADGGPGSVGHVEQSAAGTTAQSASRLLLT